jgi:hypothetical protein
MCKSKKINSIEHVETVNQNRNNVSDEPNNDIFFINALKEVDDGILSPVCVFEKKSNGDVNTHSVSL